MKLVKSLLLGSAAALVAGAGAQAADLPVRKAAPVEYVKVCDAYGAGFFYIPGTDTCIKVGGRVRADFSVSQKANIFRTAGSVNASTANTVTNIPVFDPRTGAVFNPLSVSAASENLYGWEARGRVDLDARTQTAWGTVQTVASLRLARTTGVLDVSNQSSVSPGANNASSTLEAAYIRFAGFTFGAARDNFAFMPSTFYGSGHWASFANGAKQIAYTAVLGGGLSATIAIQDAADTTNGGLNALALNNGGNLLFDPITGNFIVANSITGNGTFSRPFAFNAVNGFYAFNSFPQVNGRLDWDQGWGSLSLMGAVGQAVNDQAVSFGTATVGGATVPTDLNDRKTVWAVGAGAKINLPMIAAGDVLWLNGAYANGMTEYTVNWTYFKSSDTKRNTGGFVNQAPSWVNYTDAAGNAQIQTLKSWNLAALYTHYWTPQWRHSFLVTGGRVEGTNVSSAIPLGFPGAFGDQTTWNVGTQLAWLPTSNFEIGVDILYNRVSQDVRRLNATISPTGSITLGNGASTVTKETTNAFTGRLRVERTF